MTNLNEPPSSFLRKVREQVLKNNNNQKVKYFPKYYIFEELKPSQSKFLDNARIIIKKKNKEEGVTNPSAIFYSPRGYHWKKDMKCFLFIEFNDEYGRPAYVFPYKWLRKYDPFVPIFIPDYGYTRYIDTDTDFFNYSTAYLIRDRFLLYDCTHRLETENPRPLSLGKGDEDWCITHINIPISHRGRFYFRSFLLIKNVDFSEFDAQIESKGFKCPVPCIEGIKLKDKSLNGIYCRYVRSEDPTSSFVSFAFKRRNTSCICINCRKDCRAIEVDVQLIQKTVYVLLVNPIK